MRRFKIGLLRDSMNSKLGMIHTARLNAFWRGVEGLLCGGALWLAGLGRSLQSSASPKHRIKAADRLLGNQHLHKEFVFFYRALAAVLLRRKARPVLAVDWSEHGELAILRAVALHAGRGLTVYSETHPRKKLGNPSVQSSFLRQLKDVLPKGGQPIILTDAGFQGPWFQAVEELGWFYVGRIRNKTKCLLDGEWVPTRELYAKATHRPKSLGVVQLRRERPIPVRMIVFRKRLKGRKNLGKRGNKSRATEVKKCARRAQEPWVLVASPALKSTSARRIANLYGARFQIEQSFRDDKNTRMGWALRHSQSKCPKRVGVLCLIAATARVLCEIVGLAAEQKGLQRHFQANTESRRRVISLFNLGAQLIRSGFRAKIRRSDLAKALDSLRVAVVDPPLVRV